MSRPTQDELEDMDAAEVGLHGCLLPTGDAIPAESTDEGDDDDDE